MTFESVADAEPSTALTRFVSVGGLFVLEGSGPVVRLWCDRCCKHELLTDGTATMASAKQAHRCGPRTSAWTSRGAS